METSPNEDHADVRILPPLLFLASIALGMLLQLVIVVGFTKPIPWRIPLGLALVAFGVAAIAWVIAEMRHTHQDPDPRKPTPELIVGGPFRFARNPIYTGMALIQAGIGIALANVWIVLLLAPTLWILRREVIEQEEAYLERKFGDAYRTYKSSVRRWL
jgi:protein-S-isoprenylcysteine O-methyltransferase Ste14